MPKIITHKTHTSGIALGGIGSGTVELLPDGEFHFWQIANQPRLTTRCNEDKVDDGEGSCGALSFYLRTKKNDKVILRKLGMKTDTEDFTYRMYAFNKPVEEIEFEGKFPVCDLKYKDSALPLNLSMRAVAPFVPHNSDLSATPGFYMNFKIENPTDEEVEVSLLGSLVPDFANSTRGFKNTYINKGDFEGVFLDQAERDWDKLPDEGNLSFFISGDGERSFITGEFFRYLKEYVSHSNQFGITQESFLFPFREQGKLDNSLVGEKPETIPEKPEDLTDEALERILNLYLSMPFAKPLYQRVKKVYPDFGSSRKDKEDLLKYFKRQMEVRMNGKFGSCALCSNLTLKPYETKEVKFTLTWYFPNHLNDKGEKLGHYYENLFESSLDAALLLNEKRDEIEKKATMLSELLFTSDMKDYYKESWSSHLATIIKSSWYLKDGKFGLWEGLGFCGFHTTDITYHASFGLLALFPDLQKKQMLMGAKFQREDGRVHHFFTPDLDHVDWGFDRVDMNNQFVLMVLRDYLFTGDFNYLSSLWDNVKRAMDSIEAIDKNKDGLPDSETGSNTYDAWRFSGTPAYISVLWLAALKAAIIIAERMGDNERASYWQNLLNKGKLSLEKLLWNGKDYDLWADEDKRDKALMTNQLDGEWFLRTIGIGGNLSDQRVRDVLKFIWQQNFDEESGLKNASEYFENSTSIFTLRNCQAEAVWTGLGYFFSALALYLGETDIADIVVKSIHDNQLRFGYFWDHWECGHHYTRPMSSFSTINTALRLFVDKDNKVIKLDPVYNEVTLPLILSDVVAKLTTDNNTFIIEVIEGNIENYSIEIPEGKTLVIK